MGTFTTNVLRMMSGTGHDKVSPPIIGVMQGVAPAVQLQAFAEEAHGRKGFEESPAYNVLSGMLELKHRVNDITQLNLIEANSGRFFNWAVENFTWPCCTCCFIRSFEVPNGHIRLAEDGEGNFMLFGSGVHFVCNMFMVLEPDSIPLTRELITWGDRTIVTIKQGNIGHAEDMGQPVLLPPGLHEWQSQTLKYVKSVDLNNSIIKLGPYTILTVDEGYCAIAQDNGEQKILPGGRTHLLPHRNFKFEKFMTQKIQTNDLQRIEATSADNVTMHTDATVVWRISDVHAAAKWSAETMRHDGKDATNAAQSDVKKLCNDVLKQATASLAAFIGEIRYSDSFHVSAAGSSVATAIPVSQQQQAPSRGTTFYSPIFDGQRMASAVEAANSVTQTYGVTILQINIISAIPADHDLQQALAKGAVASAEAERSETVAQGEAKAARIRAEGDADAERIRAEGARAAAELLSTSKVAVDLARIDKVGNALSGSGTSTLFFGADSHNLGQLMSNPAVVKPTKLDGYPMN